jgi:hypothetical protein
MGMWALGGLVAAGAAALGGYVLVVRPWHRRWGASDEEVERALPGDDLVPEADFETTRAITIDAGPDEVWPWLVQIGQGRGGFYSYDLLENAMGLDIQSTGQILPQYQSLRVGDTVPVEPEGSGFAVAALEPNRYLLLEIPTEGDTEMDRVFREADAASSWLFLLEELESDQTRLVVRWRARWRLGANAMSFLIGVMLDPVEFAMEQKMMRGIKERAERRASSARPEEDLN